MFLSELEGSIQDLHDYLQAVLDELKGFLYIGEVPIGTRVENLVWIVQMDENLTAELPVRVEELPEIWTDSLGTEKLKEGEDFLIEQDRKTVRFFQKKETFKRIGNKYIFFVPYLRAKGSNLWKTFGRRLVDLYREDSEHYRTVLTAVLEYFIFGSTKTGVENLFEKTVGPGLEVNDYISKPNWWSGKVLPNWMVPRSDLFQYERMCIGSEPIDFGNYPIKFGGKEYNGKYYFYGSRSLGCIYMDEIGKYHVFSVEGEWETFSQLTKDVELWKSIYKSLFEGKLTSSYPLIYTYKNVDDPLSFADSVSDPLSVKIDVYLNNDITDGFQYGNNGLFYGLNRYYQFMFEEFSNPFKKYVLKVYYVGEELYYDGSAVYGLNDSWEKLSPRTLSSNYVRVLFFNDPEVNYGDSNVSFGANSVSNSILRPLLNYGEENVAIDHAEVYGYSLIGEIYPILAEDQYYVDKVYVASDLTGWSPLQRDFKVEIKIRFLDRIRKIFHRDPVFTLNYRIQDFAEAIDHNRYFIFVFFDELSNFTESHLITSTNVYKDLYEFNQSSDFYAFSWKKSDASLFGKTSLAFKEMFDLSIVSNVSQTFTLLY